MYEVIFENDNGKKFIFGPSGSNWFGMNIGDGMEVTLGKSQGFAQVGETVETQTVAGRPIDVTGQFFGDIVKLKNGLRNACPPLSSGRLIFQKTHYIRVFVKAAPSFSAVKNNGLFRMQFYAPYPYFRSFEEKVYRLGGVVKQFRFPVNYSRPHRFGTRSGNRYTSITNPGDVSVPFRLELHSTGISTNPTVTNLNTFAYLRLNGQLNAGDVAVIYRDDDNVLRAELTSGGVKSDIISWIEEDSSLFELASGDNLIQANDDESGVGLDACITFSPAVVALYES